MTISVIDKRHASLLANERYNRPARRKAARAEKNFVVLTLRKLSAMRSTHGTVLGSKKNARNLYDIMRSNERWMTLCKKLGIVPAKRFSWENNALNTPEQCAECDMPHRNPRAHAYDCSMAQD